MDPPGSGTKTVIPSADSQSFAVIGLDTAGRQTRVEPVVQPDYTKSRDERTGELNLTPANYKITRNLLETKAKSDAILLHSLPRMDEVPTDVDITRWSRYWQEAFNGVVMRMTLLALILGAME